MAAPLGFKDFQAGAVLTAADVDGYLMAQSVMTFADATARTAAVTSPQEGNLSFLKDTNSFEIYDGAAWVAYGAGDITGVTAGTGISGGGTSGTVTITNSMATAIDAKGDLIAGTGADAFSRLAVGTNGQVLTAASGEATGLQWATPSSGSLTQLATGSLSGTSLVLTGYSTSYKDLVLQIFGAYSSGTSTTDNIQVNSITDYNNLLLKQSSTSVTNDMNQIRVSTGSTVPTANTNEFFQYVFTNYARTDCRKIINSMVGLNAANTGLGWGISLPSASGSTTWTTITFTLTSGGTAQTISGGTYILYGRN